MLSNLQIVTIVISALNLITLITAQGSKKNVTEEVFTNSTESCEAIVNDIAVLVEPVLLIGSKSLPSTIPEIEAHCKLGNDVYKRMRKYGKCLQGLGRQTLQIYLHGLKRYIRSICNSSKKKQDAVIDLRCATTESIAGWNDCLNTVNRQLEFVAENSTAVGVVGDVCCIYSTVMSCIDRQTSTRPGCAPTADTPKFFKTAIQLVLKEVMELICSKYSSAEECLANNPEGLAKIKAAGAMQNPVQGAYLLSPLLKIVGKLSDNSEESE